MSSHLRYCPQHKKLRPCPHCALTQKPAQAPPVAVMGPESAPATPAVKVLPITITVIPPHDADAKPVPPSAISPEIRTMIKESLASKPNVISDQRTTVLVADTSEGTKKVKATDNVDFAVDDATEKVVRTSKKKSADALLTTTVKKQPAYLKSVVHSVVPSADPEAPYGRDENDRPILPGRSDQERVADLLVKRTKLDFKGAPASSPVTVLPSDSRPCGDCGHKMCKHCHPENIKRTRVLADLTRNSCPHKSNPKYCLLNYTAAPAEPVDLEDQLRRLFGLTTDNVAVPAASVQPTDAEEQLRRQFGLSTFNTTTPTTVKTFNYFPEILEITRGQLIGLLELTVGIEPRPVSRKKVLKPRAVIDSKIVELERTPPSRIIELNTLIAESKALIESWSVRVMKQRRADEDILDKPTRERYKREETKKIEKYEQEKRELQLLRKADIEQLKQRAANWGSTPDDFDTGWATTEDVMVKFEEKFKFGHEDEDSVPTHTINGYVTLLDQYDLLKDVSRRLHRFPVLDEWRYFENEIVLQAIGFGLYRPTKQTFTDYPQLRKYLNGAPVDDSEQDEPENKLILKTGGAQIGGSIRSGGHRNNHQRPLESFDKSKPPGQGPVEYGGERQDNFYGDVDSGDLTERPGDE